jgi:hypothetical protein
MLLLLLSSQHTPIIHSKLHQEVLSGVRQELKLRKARITAKTVRILQLQRMLSAKVYLKREGTLALAKSIWVRLEPCECAITSAKATYTTNDNIVVTSGSTTAAIDSEQRRHSRSSSTGSSADYDAAMYDKRVSYGHERKSSTAVLVQAHSFLASQRWVVCCMSSSAAAVCDDLRAARSIFALDCVNYFLLAYPVTSAHILTATAALRCHSTSTSSVISSGIQHEGSWLVRAGMIAAAVAEALKLPHHNYSSSSSSSSNISGTSEHSAPVQEALRLAATRCWRLLNCRWAAQEAFVVCAILCHALQTLHTNNTDATATATAATTTAAVLVVPFEAALAQASTALCTALQQSPGGVSQLWELTAAAAGIDVLKLYVDSSDVVSKGTSLTGLHSTRPNEPLLHELEERLGISPLAVESMTAASTTTSNSNSDSDSEGFDRRTVLIGSRRSSLGLGAGQGLPLCEDMQVQQSQQQRDAELASATAAAAAAAALSDASVVGRNPRLLQPSALLTSERVSALYMRLPPTVRTCSLTLLYSLEKHGASIDTLVALCGQSEPTLVVIGDTHNGCFGGFAAGKSPFCHCHSYN